MHQQIRSEPKLSPPDVERFLDTLREAGVNVVAVAGGGIEHDGGTIAIACHDDGRGRDDTAKAMATLRAKGYRPVIVEQGTNPQGYLYVGELTDKEGELMRAVHEAKEEAGSGHHVEDISVGVPHDRNGELVFPVQVFLERA